MLKKKEGNIERCQNSVMFGGTASLDMLTRFPLRCVQGWEHLPALEGGWAQERPTTTPTLSWGA
jgi:hypothetical protein